MRAVSLRRPSQAAIEAAVSSYDVNLGRAEACWASLWKVKTAVKRRSLMIDLSQNVHSIRDAMSSMTRTRERGLLLTGGGRCDRLQSLLSQMHGCQDSDVASLSNEVPERLPDFAKAHHEHLPDSASTSFFLAYSSVSQMMQIVNERNLTNVWSTNKMPRFDKHLIPTETSNDATYGSLPTRFPGIDTSPQERPRKITDCYDLCATAIGKGAFGSVYVGKHKITGTKHAIKAVEKSGSSKADGVAREIEIHGSLVHSNIARLFDSYHDAKTCFLVMELCSGGELFDRILAARDESDDGMAITETQAAKYMMQIVEGMAYLHGKSVAHRDIKPENFLMQQQDDENESQIKIIDFGLARRFQAGVPMETKAGTVFYIAPEVVLGNYDETCDVWSCGVVAYVLLSGDVPFNGSNDGEILAAVMEGNVDFPTPAWDAISAPGFDLVEELLSLDPQNRPSFSSVLGHRWLTDHSYKRY